MWHVLAYVVYVTLLVRALLSPTIGTSELVPVVVVLVAILPFDFVMFQASRGEHYGYAAIFLASAQALVYVNAHNACSSIIDCNYCYGLTTPTGT